MESKRYSPKVSKDAGLKEQSSNRKDTRPDADAGFRADPMYSTDFLSSIFCDKSRNCRLSDFWTKDPISLNAGALSRLFDATERKFSVLGIKRECNIGLRIYLSISIKQSQHEIGLTCSSKSHSLRKSFRRPHSTAKMSDSVAACPGVI